MAGGGSRRLGGHAPILRAADDLSDPTPPIVDGEPCAQHRRHEGGHSEYEQVVSCFQRMMDRTVAGLKTSKWRILVRRTVFSVIFCLAATYPCVTAAQQDRTYCEIGGYFAGEGDNFLSSLAHRALVREGLSSDTQCSSVWKGAVE